MGLVLLNSITSGGNILVQISDFLTRRFLPDCYSLTLPLTELPLKIAPVSGEQVIILISVFSPA